MTKTIELKKKICLLGEPAVGKTSLIRRFVYDIFEDRYVSTIGTKVTKKSLKLSYPSKNLVVNLTLMIWDIVGHQDLMELQPVYYQGSEGALIVCDVTRSETLSKMKDWLSSIINVTGYIPILFVANKIDLTNLQVVDEEDIRLEAERAKCSYQLTSAKTGDGVERAFYTLGTKILENTLSI